MTRLASPLTQCDGKIAHASRDDAQAHKRSIMRQSERMRSKPVPMSVYRCPHCGFYHVGRSGGKSKRRKLGR
jgi:rubrerythrin